MNLWTFRTAGIAAAAFVGASALGVGAWTVLTDRAEGRRIALGSRIYAEQCAACHGPNLEGQPNWTARLPTGRLPAPPHDASGHTWHHSDYDLFAITKNGIGSVVPGYESDMPTYGDILSDEEIRAVLAFIKSTWPPREREYQARRSTAATKD